MTSGIYLIQCLKSAKCYIGQSININGRLKGHITSLKTNKHHNIKLQRAVNKYGIDCFSFSICIMCSIDELDNYERFYINLFNSVEDGYNIENGGNNNKTINDSSRLKMSLAKKGKPSLLKGRKASEELKLKLSLAHKGLPSPKKGIKTGKPAWNSGKKGLQINPRRKKVEVFDSGVLLGTFDSIQQFTEKFNYKSKNFSKIESNLIKLGKYLLKVV